MTSPPWMKAFRWELPNDHKKTAKTLPTLAAGSFFFFFKKCLSFTLFCARHASVKGIAEALALNLAVTDV